MKSESNGVAAETNNHPNSVGILQVCNSQLCCFCFVLSVIVYEQVSVYISLKIFAPKLS